LDRRVTPAHLQLFSQPVLEHTLQQLGFEIVSAERVCEYNLPVSAYLQSLGVPRLLRNSLARVLDRFIDRGLFFRNNIRLFCRKKLLSQWTPRPAVQAMDLASVAHRAGSREISAAGMAVKTALPGSHLNPFARKGRR
jgi:hypothetical protein